MLSTIWTIEIDPTWPVLVLARREGRMENQAENITIRAQLEAEEAAVLKPPGYERERMRGRRTFRIQVAICFLLAMGLFYYFHRPPDDGRIALIPGIVAIVVLGAAFFLASDLPFMRRSFTDKKQTLKEAYAGQWELTAGREGLIVRYGKRMDVIAWGRIEKAEADPDCVYLEIGRGEHLILPRKRVLEGDWEGFVKAIRERAKGKR